MMDVRGIHSKRCWLEGKLQEATIFFDNGVITNISKGKQQHFNNVEDVGERVLMPGAIDAHVHLNEPGRSDWEGFQTGTTAAAAGGITTVVDMPLNSSPVTTSYAALQQKLASAEGQLNVNVGFYGGLIPGSINELEPLIKGGILGIKIFLTHSGIDEFPNVTREDLEQAMPLIAKHQLPLLAHCELVDADNTNSLSTHPLSYQQYLLSRPKHWENNAVKMMIELCRKTKCSTHIVHVSSADALHFIKAAKAEGLPITAETCPHYILFNAEEIPDGNTLYKCAPPIREKANNQLLKEGLLNGTLNFIASDHSPAPPSTKEVETGNLQKAWGGIAGLQFLLTAGWTSLKDCMSLENFIPLVTEQPAHFLQINNKKGFIKEGFDADFTIWSPEEREVIRTEDVFHKHKLSPYIDRELFGIVYQTYVNGVLAFGKKKLINKNAGKCLLKK